MVNMVPINRRGATYFFTLSLAQPGASTLVDEVLLLRAAVRAVRQVWPFEIDAWVVMPDHMHAIWTLPYGDMDYSVRWASIQARFSRTVPAHSLPSQQGATSPSGIWCPGFNAQQIKDADTLRTFKNHCWMDPVRHGFVADPKDWAYSSYHRDCVGVARTLPLTQAFPPCDADARVLSGVHSQ